MKSVNRSFSSRNILSVIRLAVLSLLVVAAAAAQSLHLSQTPAAVLDGRAVLQGHYEPTQMLRLAIALTPPHPAEEQQFLEDVQNKQSPLFHKFLSANEWNARFGPTEEDEDRGTYDGRSESTQNGSACGIYSPHTSIGVFNGLPEVWDRR